MTCPLCSCGHQVLRQGSIKPNSIRDHSIALVWRGGRHFRRHRPHPDATPSRFHDFADSQSDTTSSETTSSFGHPSGVSEARSNRGRGQHFANSYETTWAMPAANPSMYQGGFTSDLAWNNPPHFPSWMHTDPTIYSSIPQPIYSPTGIELYIPLPIDRAELYHLGLSSSPSKSPPSSRPQDAPRSSRDMYWTLPGDAGRVAPPSPCWILSSRRLATLVVQVEQPTIAPMVSLATRALGAAGNFTRDEMDWVFRSEDSTARVNEQPRAALKLAKEVRHAMIIAHGDKGAGKTTTLLGTPALDAPALACLPNTRVPGQTIPFSSAFHHSYHPNPPKQSRPNSPPSVHREATSVVDDLHIRREE